MTKAEINAMLDELGVDRAEYWSEARELSNKQLLTQLSLTGKAKLLASMGLSKVGLAEYATTIGPTKEVQMMIWERTLSDKDEEEQ